MAVGFDSAYIMDDKDPDREVYYDISHLYDKYRLID